MRPRLLSAKHFLRFKSNLEEVDRLTGIHTKISGSGPGRKHDVEVLHKSSIVLLTACWESFVEDAASATLAWMILTSKDHSVFPASVLERVASANSGIKAWNLAGLGWKDALRNNLKEVLARTTEKLNTPRPEQVDEIFKKTIGLQAVSSSWHWPGRPVAKAKLALDDLVTLRGSIAHRVGGSAPVRLKEVRDARDLVCRLSVKTHNALCDHLVEIIGRKPWLRICYGKTT